MNINFGGTKHGVFIDRPEMLTNDFFVNLLHFFVNLLQMGTVWKPTSADADVFEGSDCKTSKPRCYLLLARIQM